MILKHNIRVNLAMAQRYEAGVRYYNTLVFKSLVNRGIIKIIS